VHTEARSFGRERASAEVLAAAGEVKAYSFAGLSEFVARLGMSLA
jgi:hypothetical protein